jgi:dihydrolipoamide dehydrogenase
MLRSAEVFHLMHRAKEFGLKAEGIGYDLDAVVKRSRGVAKQLSGGVGHLLKKNKVETIMGEATLPAKGQVTVKTDKGETAGADRQEHHPRHRRARAGASGPRGRRQARLDLQARPAAAPHAEESCWSSAPAPSASSSPASTTPSAPTPRWSRSDRILPVEDAEIAAFAKKQFEKQGMKILEGAKGQINSTAAAAKVTAHIEQGGKDRDPRLRHRHLGRRDRGNTETWASKSWA